MGFYKKIVLFGLYLFMILCFSSGSVVIDGGNFTIRFEDIEANFAPPLGTDGLCGKLYISEPVEACSPLSNKVEKHGNCTSPIALIIRGECSFEQKIRRAQDAGFEAAIIYDNEDGGALVTMAGNSAGIEIHAAFVSKATGQKLKTFVGSYVQVWINSSYESSVWSIMAISFISLLAMSAVLATCFFVRRHRIRRERPRGRVREFHGMSSRLVKAMPSLVFTAVTEENCTASTCAICLEDYMVGDRLRILPCRHKFHTYCVDAWLTTWRTFCPVCKRDARTNTGEPPASESTPLLSSNPSSVTSSPFSSFRSSSIHSSAIQISSPNRRVPQTSRNHSMTNNLQVPRPPNSSQSQRSPSMNISRSSMDLRNMSSQRSYGTRYISPGSMGYPSMPNRYGSPYIPSPSNGSSSYIGSSSMSYPTPLPYSESAPNFSPCSSAQSLPEC